MREKKLKSWRRFEETGEPLQWRWSFHGQKGYFAAILRAEEITWVEESGFSIGGGAFSQSIAHFLEHGSSWEGVPQEVVKEIKEAIALNKG